MFEDDIGKKHVVVEHSSDSSHGSGVLQAGSKYILLEVSVLYQNFEV